MTNQTRNPKPEAGLTGRLEAGIVVLIELALLAGAAMASAPPQQQSQGEGKPPPPARRPEVSAAAVAGQLQRSGGSLLKATLSAEPDPNRASLENVSFFAVPKPEPKVLRKHDLLSIIIREESEFSTQGTTDLKKDAALEAKIEEFVKLNLSELQITGGGIGSSPPSIKMNGSRSSTGEGTVDRTDSFTARIQAEIIDVKPNGTLVLKGSKKIATDDEEQEFTITGFCRVEDVSADNTVLSSVVKDLNLTKRHKGSVRDATKRGWLTRLLDSLNPF